MSVKIWIPPNIAVISETFRSQKINSSIKVILKCKRGVEIIPLLMKLCSNEANFEQKKVFSLLNPGLLSLHVI